MRYFYVILMMATLGLQHGQAKLSEKEMTARRAYGLLGEAGKVTNNDGTFMEFDAQGNLIRQGMDGGKTVITYKFTAANQYTENGLPFKIVFEKGNVRKHIIDNGEGIYTAWTFDDKGRVVNEMEIGYPGHETKYRYQGDEMLPSESVTKEQDETGTYVTTMSYTYTRKDEAGNWLQCSAKVKYETYEDESEKPQVETKNISLSRTVSYEPVSTTKEEVAVSEENTAKPAPASSGAWLKNNYDIIVVYILLLLMIAHIVYVNFIKGERYKTVFSTDYFSGIRASKGLQPQATADENRRAIELLQKAAEEFPAVGIDAAGFEVNRPQSGSQIRRAAAFIDKAIELAPVDSKAVERINDITGVINSAEKRYFYGSKTLIVIAVVVSILLGVMMKMWTFPLIWVAAIVLYIFASRTPAYAIEKRLARGGGNATGGVIGITLRMIASATSYKITYEWPDGKKAVQHDHDEKIAAFIIALFVVFLLGACIAYFAILKYLRNYILTR
jgi:hypothetical protein